MNQREAVIRNYIDGYNQFDIDRMLAHLDANIVFENITNGVTGLSLTGIDAFRAQAEAAKGYFSSRTQTIRSIVYNGDVADVAIDYRAVLAIDLPNGLKKGEELVLQGRSLFEFSGDTVTRLTDIS